MISVRHNNSRSRSSKTPSVYWIERHGQGEGKLKNGSIEENVSCL